jgi:hypothetical protein
MYSSELQVETTVKGGMPVTVTANLGDGVYENITIRWSKSGKPVTAKFEASLTKADWETILDSLDCN